MWLCSYLLVGVGLAFVWNHYPEDAIAYLVVALFTQREAAHRG